MKTRTDILNPWIIVRWAVAAALFVGTLAIAVDQVRERDRRISDLCTALVKMEKLANQAIDMASKNNASAIETTERTIAELENIEHRTSNTGR